MVAFASFVGAKTTFTSQDMEQLLQRMTLEEKIGQMLQLNIDGLGKGKGDDFKLDEEKLHEAIGVYKVGSILNTPVLLRCQPSAGRRSSAASRRCR